MMWRDAAGDQVEASIFEWKCFGLGVSRADIDEAALMRLGLHHIEHFLSDVGCPHPRNMRCERVSDMATPGGDVERVPAFLRRGEGDEPLQALAERVRRAGQIAGRSLSELLLNEGFIHRRFQYRCRTSRIHTLSSARARYVGNNDRGCR